jgi:hypothetical protein
VRLSGSPLPKLLCDVLACLELAASLRTTFLATKTRSTEHSLDILLAIEHKTEEPAHELLYSFIRQGIGDSTLYVLRSKVGNVSWKCLVEATPEHYYELRDETSATCFSRDKQASQGKRVSGDLQQCLGCRQAHIREVVKLGAFSWGVGSRRHF